MANLPIPESAWTALGEAILIGMLIGAQREVSKDEQRLGLRDFLLIAIVGGLCGLLQNSTLTALALSSLVVFVSLFYWRAPNRSGVTTEIAALLTFCMAYAVSIPGHVVVTPLAIALTIVAVVVLEAKRTLHRFVRQSITNAEFHDTLRFLAVVLVVYPVLPAEKYGPYGFFSPQKVWLFVILVSSISYSGYFLEKFLGGERGLRLTGVLGGLASTTAATAAFARGVRESPEKLREYWEAALLANAIQFPRVLAIAALASPALAQSAWPVLAAMTGAGLALAIWISRSIPERAGTRAKMRLGNPFSLLPALKFGAVFTAILFAARWAGAELGGAGVLMTALIGGSFDADAVVVSAGELLRANQIAAREAETALLLALFSNAVLKTVLAFTGGSREFGWRVGLGFVVMLTAGALMVAGRS